MFWEGTTFAFPPIFIGMETETYRTIKRIVAEELTRSDVRDIFDSEIGSFTKGKDFKNAVREIAADVIEVLYRELWRKSNTWKGALKRGN